MKFRFYLAAMALSSAVGASSGGAATNIAASASWNDVTAAVQASTDGDTVRIPAGVVTWSNAIVFSKALTVIGAGTNATIITAAHAFSVAVPPGKNDMLLRISGMTFLGGYNSGDAIIALHGRDHYALDEPINNFRVDHCRFEGGVRSVQPMGWCYGVVDHCSFFDPAIGVGPIGDDNYAWQRPIAPGTTNSVCIEDCEFYLTPKANVPLYFGGGWPQEFVYHQEGTRSIIRRCLFDSTGYTAGDFANAIDAHGNQNYFQNDSLDFRGTIMVECYSNVFRAYRTQRFMYYRGGTCLVYDNAFTNVATGPCFPIVITEEEGWDSGFFSPLRYSWPAEDQITNSFFWNNFYNGAPTMPINTELNFNRDDLLIQAGRDYWLHPPQPGQAYYPYKPLAYPHPQVVAQDRWQATNYVAAVASAMTNAGVAPFTAQLSAIGSFSAAGVLLTYAWDFGDGAQANGFAVAHNYSRPGIYQAKLSVSDGITTAVCTNLVITVTGAANKPPVVQARALPTGGFAPVSVSFSSAGTYDPEGTPLTYSWTFGDGAKAVGANPIHVFTIPGPYSAKLEVTDGTNTVTFSPIKITVASGQ